ncbi:MAG TPA: lysine--tRNA ligase [Polyangiaceae bacterium]|jgi:lysyl-tRNA synthetase class 2
MSDAQKTGAEAAILEARRAKMRRIRERGENPFANDFAAWGGALDDVSAVRAAAGSARAEGGKYDTAKVDALGKTSHVAGRVIALRSAGALSFVRLRDRTGELQLLLDQSKLGDAYARLDDVDVGDILEAKGALTASKRGELSVVPTAFRVLTKSLRPLPEKWHGITDVEARYRQRYVDLIASSDVGGPKDVFRARSLAVRATRKILDDHDFLEVETPTMSTIVGGAIARPFKTHHNALELDLFMRIAPELYLKRLLVGGLERVYEIGRCYRNEGLSTRHNPEFTMLEFYWAYATYDVLMDFTETMLRFVDAELAKALPEPHAKWAAERPFTLARFERISMNDAVSRAARKTEIAEFQSGDLVALLRPGFVEKVKDWSKTSARAKKVDWSNFRKGFEKCENDGERLFACYEYLAEPFLTDDYRAGDKSVPVFITDYPFETSPLARRNDSRPELVDRFELFVHGREICNAFSELNDPDDQRARFEEQVAKKARGEEETMDYDEDYVRALEQAMPPAAGFGMGIDRVVMALTNAPSIRDVILFPLLRPQ